MQETVVLNGRATPQHLAALNTIGDPNLFRIIVAAKEGGWRLVWQAQPGMQQRLFDLTNPTLKHPATEILLGGLRGPGKASSLDSVVMTPHGPKKMRDIRVGSLVSNPDGSVATVIGVYPQGPVPVFRVSFSDGGSTVVSGDHLWLASRTCRPVKADRRYAPFLEENRTDYKIWTTQKLIQLLDSEAEKEQPANLLIPLSRPVEFTTAHWARWGGRIGIDPYVVGLLLGDGSLRPGNFRFTTADEEIIGELRSRTGIEFRHYPPYDYRVAGAQALIERLEGLGIWNKLSHEKSIPEIYRAAPISVRWEIVRGLMDTDGSVDTRDGTCSFCSTSETLARDMQWMLRSLGFRVGLRSKQGAYRKDNGEVVECRIAYELHIQGQELKNLFRLSRKREKCPGRFNGGVTIPKRRIVNIESAGVEEAQCIAVDHPNQLYITDDFIVTHNTDALIAWMAELTGNPHYRGLLLRFSGEAIKETIDRCHEIYTAMGAIQKGQPAEFWFPSGAKIYTGHIRDERALENYKGHEYHRIGLEEASQVGKFESYNYLFGSNRSKYKDIKAAICLTSNPDGPGNGWLQKHFVKFLDSRGEMVPWGTPFADQITKRVRVFIPGKRSDNQILLENDPTYYDRMGRLSPQKKRAWIDGDWDAALGSFFPEFRRIRIENEPENALHVIPPAPIAPWCHRWISADYGYSHHTAVYWHAFNDDRRMHTYREYVTRHREPAEVGAEVAKKSYDELQHVERRQMVVHFSPEKFSRTQGEKTVADQFADGIRQVLGPKSCFVLRILEEERHMPPEEQLRSMRERRREIEDNPMSIVVVPANANREAGHTYVRRLMRWYKLQEIYKPDIDQAKKLLTQVNGHLKYAQYIAMFQGQDEEVVPAMQIHDTCPILIETIPRLQPDPDKLDDCLKFNSDDTSVGDDPYDAYRYGAMAFKELTRTMPLMQAVVEQVRAAGYDDINQKIMMMEMLLGRDRPDETGPLSVPRGHDLDSTGPDEDWLDTNEW